MSKYLENDNRRFYVYKMYYENEDFYKSHKWEYSRNCTIDKIIYALKYDKIIIDNE